MSGRADVRTPAATAATCWTVRYPDPETEGSDVSEMDHKGEELKGRVKEAAGDLTDNEELQAEGQMDQAGAKIKRAFEGVVDKVKDVFDGDDDKK